MQVIERVQGRRFPRLSVTLGGVVLDFRQITLPDGQPTMLAPLPADADVVARLRVAVALMTGRYSIRDCPTLPSVPAWLQPGPVTLPTPSTAAVSAPPPPSEKIGTPALLALQRGWSDADLDGTGIGGDFGAAGGRSARSGLTAAEMALTDPPGGWEVMATQSWPWLLPGWTAPGPAWTPPDVPRRGAIVEEEPSAAPAKRLPASKDPDVVEQLADYPERDAAEALLRRLTDEAGGKVPSDGKARYHLNKHGLPPMRPAQIRALLAHIEAGASGR